MKYTYVVTDFLLFAVCSMQTRAVVGVQLLLFSEVSSSLDYSIGALYLTQANMRQIEMDKCHDLRRYTTENTVKQHMKGTRIIARYTVKGL